MTGQGGHEQKIILHHIQVALSLILDDNMLQEEEEENKNLWIPEINIAFCCDFYVSRAGEKDLKSDHLMLEQPLIRATVWFKISGTSWLRRMSFVWWTWRRWRRRTHAGRCSPSTTPPGGGTSMWWSTSPSAPGRAGWPVGNYLQTWFPYICSHLFL